MANISGKAGLVQVGTATATVEGIKSWSVDYTGDALETTDFGDSGHKTYIPGIDGWSGSFSGFKDGAPQAIGTLVALILKESATTGQQYSGSAIITGAHPSVDVDGVVGISYDFQGSAALVTATT